METKEKQPETEGIDFTPELVRTIIMHQDDDNVYADFHIESIADLICLILGEVNGQVGKETTLKLLPYLQILANIRDDIKDLKSTK